MGPRTTKLNHRQITLAREYRGYTQSELSKKVSGVSQSNLSKYEKGLGGLSDDAVDKIISYLDFPKSFFYYNIFNNIQYAHYRKRSTITKQLRTSLSTDLKLIGFIIDMMSDSLEWPEYNFSSFDVENGHFPESIARFLRKKIGLKEIYPVENIIQLLEENGIIVVEYDSPTDKFDGVSFTTDSGVPVIVINKYFSNDRKRFTLAHELGHLVMHILNDTPISEYRDKEDEANRFASEFLMPESAILNSLYGLKISDLGQLKSFWLTSMASIIYRAKELKAIDDNRAKYLNIELSRRGYKKKEPIQVSIDEAVLFKAAFSMHKNDLDYSDNDFVNGFSLPIEIINNFFRKNSTSKLRVLL